MREGECMKHISRKKILYLSVLVMASCGRFVSQNARGLEEFCTMFEKPISSIQDVYNIFPKNVQDVEYYASSAIQRAQRDLDALQTFSSDERTFQNTARALDTIGAQFGQVCNAIEILEMIDPRADVRDACHKEIIKLRAFAVDAFSNKKVYNAFKEYVEGAAKKESLNAEEQYFLSESMRDFKRAGLDLPDDTFKKLQDLKKELSELTLAYDTNINNDASSITATAEELKGCDEHFIKSLTKDADGNYIVRCDYPSYFEVIDNCTVAQTRQRHYFAFSNRACPANIDLLEKIIAKRDELARMVGYASYAAYDTDDQMVKTPQRAEAFIRELAGHAHKKARQELKTFTQELPEGVVFDTQGKVSPWDVRYIKNCYKKKHLQLDERIVAEYFTVERTLKGVFDIYQQFLSFDFSIHKPAWSWHDDVQLIEVRDRGTSTVRGYIFIDLYPRDNKYSHACQAGIVHTVKNKQADGSVLKTPSVAVVIANFPKPTGDRPALLKHSDVETFFHEFGHAMHTVLGCTEMSAFSGTEVKRDFVEMPSQIFEEWMFDKSLLKNLSAHYKTNEPLSDELVDKLIALKKFDSGMFLERQCLLSLISLECFKEGAQKNTGSLIEKLTKSLIPDVRFEPNTHMQASFGHLTNYGAKYYGYMWSKVFALDIFAVIKKQGLLNPEAGRLFIDKILSKGGSVDPNVLLKDYLGREPQQEAFFEDLGIKV